MSENDLFVKGANHVSHPRVSLDRHTHVRCRLNEEDIIGLRTKLQDHGRVVELRPSICPDDASACCVALEQQNVEGVSLLQELLLRNLFLTPKFRSLGRPRLLDEAFRRPNVLVDDVDPAEGLLCTFRLEPELSIVSLHFDEELVGLLGAYSDCAVVKIKI